MKLSYKSVIYNMRAPNLKFNVQGSALNVT